MNRFRRNTLLATLLWFALVLNAVFFAFGVLQQFGFKTTSNNEAGQGHSYTHIGCQNATIVSSTSTQENKTNNSSMLVPNIVHYVWYTTEPRLLKWHHMLCIYSAHKMLKPDAIYFHCNMEPTGTYWERVLQLPTFMVKKRNPPTSLFGEKIKAPIYYTSHSNVDRVKILMEHGGIYLDLDMLVLKPFDELREQYQCTIGREIETKVCGSVVICSKESLFLTLWINSYLDDYRVDEWAYNTGKVPFNLARRYPHLVHVDEDRLNRPNFFELAMIWSPTVRFDWRRNYAVHLYYRLWKDQSEFYHGIEPNDDNVKTWNASFGEMARTVLYGSPKILHTDGLA